jgi:hypothetical protein
MAKAARAAKAKKVSRPARSARAAKAGKRPKASQAAKAASASRKSRAVKRAPAARPAKTARPAQAAKAAKRTTLAKAVRRPKAAKATKRPAKAARRAAAARPAKATAAARRSRGALAQNVRRLARLEMPGGGQVVVQGDYAYIGHMDPPAGTSIVDVSDPRKPRLVSHIKLPDLHSHSHKVRVAGDLMVVNSEMFDRHFLRKGWVIAETTARLQREQGRAPSDAELAKALGVKESDLPRLREAGRRGYRDPGFKIYDVSQRSKPRLIHFQKTWGVGVHRFDMDERYAYISTEKDGFHGNILCIYDLANPARPEPVADWWMPGQHIAAGDKPTWRGYRNRLHHGLRAGNRIYAACWHAGFHVLDVSDISKPRSIARHTYHPPVVEPTHTVMPVPHRVGGRQVALVIDEEHDHIRGQPHAMLWVFDIGNLEAIQPLSNYTVSETDSPYSRLGKRFGAHQFQEHLESNVVCATWFSGGLRLVDISDPTLPREVGYFIPEPAPGQSVPQTNDVDVDARGLIYTIDRLGGLDILERTA